MIEKSKCQLPAMNYKSIQGFQSTFKQEKLHLDHFKNLIEEFLNFILILAVGHTNKFFCDINKECLGKNCVRIFVLEAGQQRARQMEAGGLDSGGRQFKNAKEMWREEIGEEGDLQKRADWYREGVGYWQDVEATLDGVLGGYGLVNEADIKGSEAFLKTLLSERVANGGRSQHLVALDCGSGIGRVTKNLLVKYFNEVDLVEPVSHFLDAARESLAPERLMVPDLHKAANFFCLPLQEFTPETGRYDVIWIQWCIGQLADDDFVSFFKRAKAGLKPGGFFVLKENIARTGFVLDKEDRSITRSDTYFKELFSRCGLHLYKSKDQKEFPKELFAVNMYALTTERPKRANGASGKVHANRPAVIK
ncbi:alpha N-terminal protein methyltransferase 1 [Malania oleifera]|uniref:alpha N-terminal protein methyltransferase 1 n=1 Tax=Malania oleifera TaxID=397392 RepID=UPI0025AE753B|nr:alpha N-terminal protein methyltransferase 1 [Malania oleifera]